MRFPQGRWRQRQDEFGGGSYGGSPGPAPETPPLGVLGNRHFLSLWLAQASTQIGGNMVLYGLTIVVYGITRSNSAVSLLILTFLVPAVVFSAVAGVYVDRFDRRLILIGTNVLRGVAFLLMVVVSDQLALVYLLNVIVSTVTTFFAPAEAAMIPTLVERERLLQANGLFTFTLNASFAIGFALLGPLVVNLAGPNALLLLVAALYFVAAALCVTLPSASPEEGPPEESALGGAERAVASMFLQLREGLAYIRSDPRIFWSLAYLAITASLIGVLGVLGPDFATKALGLREQDFVVVVLPLGAGIVMGILILNAYGRYLPRRRVIEGGLIGLSLALLTLSIAGPLTRFLQARAAEQRIVDLGGLVSLLSIVVVLALVAGAAYAFVAIPAQTQLQEELPEEVRGRVFGVLNMLVSISSFLPIVVVGPVADLVGTPAVLVAAAVIVGGAGIGSIAMVQQARPVAAIASHLAAVDPVAVATGVLGDREGRGQAGRAEPGGASGATPHGPAATPHGPEAAHHLGAERRTSAAGEASDGRGRAHGEDPAAHGAGMHPDATRREPTAGARPDAADAAPGTRPDAAGPPAVPAPDGGRGRRAEGPVEALGRSLDRGARDFRHRFLRRGPPAPARRDAGAVPGRDLAPRTGLTPPAGADPADETDAPDSRRGSDPGDDPGPGGAGR